MDKLTKLVMLLVEQIGLQDQLHSKMLLRLQSTIGADFSRHERDRHHRYWDPGYYLEQEKKDNAEIDELYKRLVENKKRIDALKKELAPAAA